MGAASDMFTEEAIEKIKKYLKMRELRKHIDEQIEREKACFERNGLDEEFDFGGLADCLINKLTDEETIVRFAAIDNEARNREKELIVNMCIRDSKAKPEAEEKVRGIANRFIGIVEKHIAENVSMELVALGIQVVDSVNAHLDKQINIFKDEINKIQVSERVPAEPERPPFITDNEDYVRRFTEPLFLEDEEQGNVISLSDIYISPGIKEKDQTAAEFVMEWYSSRFMTPCLLLYGSAGVGKSSFVSKIAADAYVETENPEFPINRSDVMTVMLRKHTDIDYNELSAGEILEELFSCRDIRLLKNKLLILDGLDELCVLCPVFDGLRFLKKISRLERGFHVIITSRESRNYFNAPENEKGIKIGRLLWDIEQIDKWLEKYKEKKPEKQEWCSTFRKQFSEFSDNDDRRGVFCVPIILYICGTSETDLADHKDIGSIYNDAFRNILLRQHINGQCKSYEITEADKVSNLTAWQYTKEIAYQMFLLKTLDLVDGNGEASDEYIAKGLGNAKKRTMAVLEDFGIKDASLDIKKELALCPFTKEDNCGGITFAHKTVYEYFTAVKLYEDYFARFTEEYFKNTDEDTAAREVMECIVEAFRYDAISREVFDYLCKMDCEPFSEELGFASPNGTLDYKGFEAAFMYGMNNNLYARIGLKPGVDEYLYSYYYKSWEGKREAKSWINKSAAKQINTAFANFTWFLTGHGVRNMPEKECVELIKLSENGINVICLEGWNLKGYNLRFLNLSYAEMQEAELIDADLTETDLSNSILALVDFTGANLSDTNFEEALLFGADMEDADLNGTNFMRADLSGAFLAEADLTRAYLCQALYGGEINKTFFPDGFDPKEHDMIEIDEDGNEISKD